LHKKIPVILPIHPRTQAALEAEGLLEMVVQSIRVVEPIGYLDMVMLEKNAALIATDSGGVQKEAFFHRVPCVTLRDETEWVELVDYWMEQSGFSNITFTNRRSYQGCFLET